MPEIDIGAVLAEKAPAAARWIPRFAVNWLRRTIHEREINHILEHYWSLPPQEFIRACFRQWQVTYSIEGLERIDPAGRYLFVSNHPFGGMDGMMLADKLIDRFGDPPGAVNALIHVALLRGEAGRAGISDISQKGNMLYFKVENFDMETLSALYAQKEFKNRVKLEAGREPRLGLKLRPGARPIPEARALVEAWNKLQKPAAEPAAEKE